MGQRIQDLGAASYDDHEFGATWWLSRACDTVHRRAYQNIAKAVYSTAPDAVTIIDYACGPGLLLCELAKRMPQARLFGLDESKDMLNGARIVSGNRLSIEQALTITFQHAALPHFKLDLPKADVVTFSFPDFRDDLDGTVIKRLKKRFPKDWEHTKQAAKQFKRAAKLDDECDPTDSWISDVDRMFFERCATRNIHKLLTKRGYLVRVDYAPGDRETWIDPFLDRFDWTCASLDPGTCSGAGTAKYNWFERVSSRYFDSKVIHDVHAQTGDDEHTEGGYMISVLRKL